MDALLTATQDFFYVCPIHLKDRSFCNPIIDEAAVAARKTKELEEEKERVKKEYEEKQRKKKEKEEKAKDKDKDKDAKKGEAEDKSSDDKVCGVFTLCLIELRHWDLALTQLQ
jgi:sRNA-binding protein